jgi:TRAP-type transport system periplasmic protein
MKPKHWIRGWRASLFITGLVAVSLMILPTVGISAEKSITIKGAHTVAVTNSQHTPWFKFKEVVEKKSNGKVKVEIFPNAMMGSDNEIMEKVQLGAVNMGHASTSNLTNIVPKFGAFELPYVVRDVHDNMKALYRDGKVGGPVFDILSQEMLAKNLKMLWISPASFRGVGATKPVKLPDDLKGLKIRCTASPVDREALQAFGANPVAMGFGEVYTALQQGTIDAEGLPPDLMYDMKHHEVIKYVVMNNYNVFLLPVSMNVKYYNGLPKDVQKLVDEASVEAVKYANEQWVVMLNDRVKKMQDAGVKIHYPTKEEWPLWIEKVKPVIEKHTPKIGSDFVKLVKDTLGVK